MVKGQYPEIEAMKKAKIEVEKLHHKQRMAEIESERKARLEVEQLKFEHIMSAYRIKRADTNRDGGYNKY